MVKINPVLIRQILAGLFVLASVIATINFGMLPQFDALREKIAAAEEVDLNTALELQELTRLQTLEKARNVVENQLLDLSAAIPSDIQYSSFVDILDVIAERNDVEINFLSIGNATAYLVPEHIADDELIAPAVAKVGERLLAIPVDFSATGTSAQLLNFMGDLQSSPRTTVIQGVSFSRSESTQFSLTLQTFIYSIAPAQ